MMAPALASDIATSDLLDQLKDLYPINGENGESHENPWYIVAAVAFTGSNLPEAVPIVYQHALNDLRRRRAQDHPEGKTQEEIDADELLLVRRIKDAIFKAGITFGYPRTINGLIELHKVIPEHLHDKTPLRDNTLPTSEYIRRGQDLFAQTYGETTDSVQGLLDSIYPDAGYFCTAYGYGYAYSFSGVAPSPSAAARETSYTLIAALIASDTPTQIRWHLAGARRNGGSVEQVRAVREMAMKVASAAGVRWKGEVPDVVG